MSLWRTSLAAALAVWSAQATAQSAAPADQTRQVAAQPPPSVSAQNAPDVAAAAAHPPSPDEICRAIEESAGENGLPVEFFARVIWQESRFKAEAVSPKGAEGIAQFMPATAEFRGLADPFDAIAALHKSADYLAELRKQFGNLGLAAAAYNAGPGRVSAWRAGTGVLPNETRSYVAITTGHSADDWASPSPPKEAESALPHGLPCRALAHLIVAKPSEPAPPPLPRWGMQLAANWSESVAWASYHRIEKQYASVLGGHEAAVVKTHDYGHGSAIRYAIRVSSNDFSALQKLCNKLVMAGGACVVLPNTHERAAVASRK